jgi:hypothetical protein
MYASGGRQVHFWISVFMDFSIFDFADGFAFLFWGKDKN